MEHKSEKNLSRVAEFFCRSTVEPVCRIQSTADIDSWQISKAYFTLITYLNDVSTEIQGIRNTDSFPVSENIRRLTAIFDSLDAMILSNPPAPVVQGSNASASLDPGNKSYRRWANSMLRDIFQMVEKAVPVRKCRHVNELGVYLSGAFGSSTKIEYGTGHELSFMFFLCALFKAEILSREEDLAASALVLFERYLKFVRRLQVTYSVISSNWHGGYSLDKFQFVPFIWGFAQLCYEAPFSPQKMLDADTIEQYKREYMLIDCVGHMANTYIGTFARHSSQLWSLAALSSWTKIHRGLMFMYMEEILLDFDNLNGLRFGELMPFEEDKSGRHLGHARLGVKSSLRRQMDEDQENQDQDQELASRSVTPSISRSDLNEGNIEKPRMEDEFSDVMSNSGLSMGSDSTSLSGVSVHLPTWMDDGPSINKHTFKN
ncbi:serine/threonine-protein phosphatase 2A activator [Drosophila gunungcola]|uniref:serine/threonine-protein phosphatase 2A activator n=1 Tax=Drosophila gunungcola TaxID=103775 RepID=UPI0022E56517|nr:serine/threonine-protein phosphatase 2A activator [Drosophila gunungcola]